MFFPISIVHRKLPIYTPIPLGGVSNEFFGIVAFCPPDENRLKIAENSNKVKQFVVDITQTAIELYSEQIFSVVEISNAFKFASLDGFKDCFLNLKIFTSSFVYQCYNINKHKI